MSAKMLPTVLWFLSLLTETAAEPGPPPTSGSGILYYIA